MIEFDRWSNRAIAASMDRLDSDDCTRAEFELTLRKGRGMYEGEISTLQGLSTKELQELVRDGCSRISDLERVVHIANDILKNGYVIPENVTPGEE